MTQHHSFPPEPWAVRETELDLSTLAQSESIFALSNGHIGLRANLEEGEPHGLPGTYLNSFYETRSLPYAEPGYGYPEVGQEVVNVTNGKVIRLLVDDEPFDVRYGRLRTHERVLDLRAGVLRRRAEWVSPARQAVRVSSIRLVSFAQRAIAAILYEVEPLGTPARLVVQSDLVANEPLPATVGKDPRAGSGMGSALCSEFFFDHDARVVLVHRTKESGLRMAAGMDHLVEGPPATQTTAESSEDLGRVTVATELEPGQRLRLVKFVGYGWSSQRSLPSVRDQVEAALAAARRSGWEGLLAAQRAYLDDFWARGPLRALPHPAGRRPRGGARDTGQGADRPGLRRAHVLGHRDVRPAAPHLYRPARRWRRAPMAPRHTRPRPRACEGSPARRCRLPLAHHPRPAGLGILAGQHRRLPHQR
jgi:alpha,alpha-trehalose phosphorylase